MRKTREVITVCQTACWLQRCVAANQTKPGPLFYQDEMGPLDAPEWIPTGGVSVTASDRAIVVHGVLR